MFESEAKWRERLKSILELDYGHQVFEEVYFKNDHDKGYVDLYVLTHPDWEHHDTFQRIGIECKLLERAGMNWLISSGEQMRRYMDSSNVFHYNGQRFEPLDICLVATPESWHEGFVYKWNGQLSSGPAKPCCWESITFIFQRILLKNGCSILLNKRFQSNKEGGPIRSYYLGE